MRSQLRFVMHANDEKAFAKHVLSDKSVFLIDGTRWKTATPDTHRSLEGVLGRYCMIWSTQDCATLDASYHTAGNEWHYESNHATVQFLRSQTCAAVITEGRIAVSTEGAQEGQANGVARRFRALRRFIKQHYTNAVLQWCNPNLPLAPEGLGRSANPSTPDRQVWVGPHALAWLREDSARCVKQDTRSIVEAYLVASAAQ